MKRIQFKSTSARRLLWITSLVGLLGISGVGVASTAVAPVLVADAGTAIMDTTTTATINEKLINESILKRSQIDVSTARGAVTLEGSASSATAKAVAEAIARSVDGVASVQNNLHVSLMKKAPAKAPNAATTTATSTKHVVTDSWITTKVKSEILANSVSKGFEVNVETLRGAVVLKGVLANQTAIDQVKNIAQRVDGVTSVDTVGLTIAVK